MKKYTMQLNSRQELILVSHFYILFGIPTERKILPSTIFDDLTPIALAIWAQGDVTRRNKGFTFNTQSFTLQQAVLLLNVLHVKFGLDCTIYFDRGKPLVHVRSNSMNIFRALVYPYFHPSMLYKLQ